MPFTLFKFDPPYDEGGLTTPALVRNRFDTTMSYAVELKNQSLTLLEDLLTGLGTVGFGGSTHFTSGRLGGKLLTVPSFVLGDWGDDLETPNINLEYTRPIQPDLTTDVDSVTFPVLGALDDVDVPDVTIPIFNINTPIITDPDFPIVTWPTEPGDPPSTGFRPIPGTPVYTFPTPPVISEIVIDGPPELSIPAFEGTLPDMDLTPPGTAFVYEENIYSSELLEEIKEKLLVDVGSADSGLGAAVSEEIWENADNRLQEVLERHYDEIDRVYAARGFSIPPGAAAAARAEVLNKINKDYVDQDARITEMQAKLALQNAQFIVDKILDLEKTLIQQNNWIAQRAFEKAVAVIGAAVQLYNAKVAGYTARVQAYEAARRVYVAMIQAQMLVLEAYKIKIESYRLEADIQKSQVAVYTAQLNAINIQLQIFRTELEGVEVFYKMEGQKLLTYRTKIEAYVARIGANTARFNAYGMEIAGEQAKVNLYEGEVRAFGHRMEAVKTEADINKTQAETTLAKNQEVLTIYAADLQKAMSQIDVELRELESLTKAYGYNIEGYKGEIQAEATKAAAEINVFRAEVDKMDVQSRIAIRQAEMQQTAVLELNKLIVAGMEFGTNTTAQLAASMATAVHTTMSVGFSESQAQSQAESRSDGYSESDSIVTSYEG